MKKIIGLILLITLSQATFGQEIRIDVVTSLNSASKIQVQNDSLIAATSGGFFIYDLDQEAYHSWTVADGFYSNSFSTFERTLHDVIALGSDNGMVSFFDLRDHDISNETSLQGNNIVDMMSVDDTLWVLTSDLVSVYKYNPQSRGFQFVDFFQNFPSDFSSLTSLHHSLDQIWIGSSNGIFRAPSNYVKHNLKSSSNWTHINTTQNPPGSPINSVFDIGGNDSTLFLATDNGLVRIDSQSITRLATGVIRGVRTHNDEIFVSNNNAVYKYENGSYQLLHTYPSIMVMDFALDQSGSIWVSLEQRGVVQAGTNYKILPDGPLNNFIGEVYLDSRGWLWCTSGTVQGQSREGVFLKRTSEWINFKYIGPGIWRTMSNTLFLIEDTGGNIWVSAWNGGVTIFDENLNITPINRLSTPGNVWRKSVSIDDTIQVQTPAELQNVLSGQLDNQSYTTVTDFYLDENNQSIWLLELYASSDEPIVRLKNTAFSNTALEPSMWQSYSNPETGGFSNHLLTITKDIFDIFWIASDRNGIFRMQIDDQGNRTGWDVIDHNDGIKSDDILDIEPDEDGYVWIGTQAGLSAYLSGTVFDFREEFQPVGFRINDIHIDSQNNKWFATDKGLSILRSSGSPFDPASWIHLVPRTSSVLRQNTLFVDLPSENISSVFLDENTGDVYLGTDSGIAIIRSNPFTSPFTTYDNVRMGPNPFYLSENSSEFLRFYNLVSGSEVKILTANGRLVRSLNPDNLDEIPGSQAQWDGRNMEGELVASGVYVYLITTEDGEAKAGKFLLVRE